ncbi:hypothetical protein [Cocleimonas sp. KMM 6896]|nr:hypothetical protein [Cocleimonas sp. KMM 6896]MEC4746852.1 hypothetical protein [Cocleimonas sp. KMM 6896]
MPPTIPINHYSAHKPKIYEVVFYYSMLTYSGASLPETLYFPHG